MDLCGEPRWGKVQWVCSLQGPKKAGSSPDPPSGAPERRGPSHTFPFNGEGKPLPTQARSPEGRQASGRPPSSNLSWLLVLTRP